VSETARKAVIEFDFAARAIEHVTIGDFPVGNKY